MFKDKSRDSEKQCKSLEANNYKQEYESTERQHTHGGLWCTAAFSRQSKEMWFLGSYSIYTVYHSPVSNVMVQLRPHLLHKSKTAKFYYII